MDRHISGCMPWRVMVLSSFNNFYETYTARALLNLQFEIYDYFSITIVCLCWCLPWGLYKVTGDAVLGKKRRILHLSCQYKLLVNQWWRQGRSKVPSEETAWVGSRLAYNKTTLCFTVFWSRQPWQILLSFFWCVFQLTRGIIIRHIYFCVSSVSLPYAPLVQDVCWMLR